MSLAALLDDQDRGHADVNGEFFATDDTCTHELSSLADGYVDGDEVECSWHFAKFCIRTGEVRSLPATKPLRIFKIVVEDGSVFVELDDDRQVEI